MAITVDREESVRRLEVIVRVIHLPERIGTLLDHSTPIALQQLLGTVVHATLDHRLDHIMVRIGDPG